MSSERKYHFYAQIHLKTHFNQPLHKSSSFTFQTAYWSWGRSTDHTEENVVSRVFPHSDIYKKTITFILLSPNTLRFNFIYIFLHSLSNILNMHLCFLDRSKQNYLRYYTKIKLSKQSNEVNETHNTSLQHQLRPW